ncbi:MAG: chitobiase/beta-hexosaminidase C-terminal domain-containing protein [Deltaproteobacteria bacterium]|nr:chitobiase/beta-hexosaminidase C-terminal domain-containing protein [Deltaproteobacteria bacterium]
MFERVLKIALVAACAIALFGITACEIPAVGEQVAAPQISLESGVYYGPQEVTITCEDGDATIRYTTDGSNPGETAGTLYEGPFQINYGCTVKAIACKPNKRPSVIPAGSYTIPLVITSGNYDNGTTDIPCYWLGNVRTDLPIDGVLGGNGTESYPYAGSIYTSGYYWIPYPEGAGTLQIPCYWRNTTRVDLFSPTDGYDGNANAIMVINGTVYTAGSYDDGSGSYKPCYWINTTRYDLEIPGNWAMVNDLFVSNGIVYTCGSYATTEGQMIPCYWTGTFKTDLPGNADMYTGAFGIFISGQTVFTSGHLWDGSKIFPCYWVGTNRTDLSGDGVHHAGARRLFVYNGTIYTSGMYSDGSQFIPCYWTGTVKTDLPGASGDLLHVSGAYDICVSIGTVYTAGMWYDGSKHVACYWTDTTRTDLPADGSAHAVANTIYMY